MSEEDFFVTGVELQSIDSQNNNGQSLIERQEAKEDCTAIKDEDTFLLSIDRFNDNTNNLQVLDNIIGPLNINENITFNVQFMEEQSNVISDVNPIDIPNVLKTEVKDENCPSHYIKYEVVKGKAMKIWQCGICMKKFGHQYVLMRHLPTHTDERKFRCLTCGKAFRQMSTLSQHKAIHSAERPYICEICNKTFNRVSTLISHRKTHNGLKPHKCHICNKAFHQKGNLRNHIFTHTNERPYKCDVCSKGFNQMSNLMCHKIKAHQRADKPMYTCRSCGKEFQKRIGLRNHEQYEHGQVPDKMSNNYYEAPSMNPIQSYSNSILVDPIETPAMRDALTTNQVPFALLKPLHGDPVLVRVFPAGEKQMLLPASAEDLKRQGVITINPKTEEISDINDETDADKLPGSTVQIRVPVVATVVQSCNQEGDTCMYVENNESKYDNIYINDKKEFTTNNDDVNYKFDEFLINENDDLPIENSTNITEYVELKDCEENVDTHLNSFINEESIKTSENINDLTTNQTDVELYSEEVLDLSNNGEIARVYQLNGIVGSPNNDDLLTPVLKNSDHPNGSDNFLIANILMNSKF